MLPRIAAGPFDAGQETLDGRGGISFRSWRAARTSAVRAGRDRSTPSTSDNLRRRSPRASATESTRWNREQPRLIAGVGLADAARKSRWPARLDLAQSATGLVLALFMWGHMFFVSSILISKDAMWTITKFFEGYFFFGTSYPVIVSFVVAGGDRAVRRARAARGAQVPDQLPPVHDCSAAT